MLAHADAYGLQKQSGLMSSGIMIWLPVRMCRASARSGSSMAMRY
jgi:hypothetical protein